LEYAAEVWDLHLKCNVEAMERIQNEATRFIVKIDRGDSVTKAKENLNLVALETRPNSSRIRLLMSILSNDACRVDLEEYMTCA
jgi:hypothetical protein